MATHRTVFKQGSAILIRDSSQMLFLSVSKCHVQNAPLGVPGHKCASESVTGDERNSANMDKTNISHPDNYGFVAFGKVQTAPSIS
jgi:hypothetical protein